MIEIFLSFISKINFQNNNTTRMGTMKNFFVNFYYSSFYYYDFSIVLNNNFEVINFSLKNKYVQFTPKFYILHFCYIT